MALRPHSFFEGLQCSPVFRRQPLQLSDCSYTQDTVPDLAAGGLSLVPEEGGAGSPWVSLLQRNAVNPLVSEESGQVSSALQSPAGGLEVEMHLPSGLNDLLQKPPSQGTLALQARCRSLSLQKGSCFLPVAGWQSGSPCSRGGALVSSSHGRSSSRRPSRSPLCSLEQKPLA